MKTALFAAALALASASALAADPAYDPDHDHRHGARTDAPPRDEPPHLTLVQAAQYISAQVPGEIRSVQAYPGASVYRVDVDLVNGARAGFEVNAHDGAVSWREMPVVRGPGGHRGDLRQVESGAGSSCMRGAGCRETTP